MEAYPARNPAWVLRLRQRWAGLCLFGYCFRAYLVLAAVYALILWAATGCNQSQKKASAAHVALQTEAARIQYSNEQAAQAFEGIRAVASVFAERWDAYARNPATTMPSAEETRDAFRDIDQTAGRGQQATGEINKSVPKVQVEASKLKAAVDEALADRDRLKNSWSYRIGHAILVFWWVFVGLQVGGFALRTFAGGPLASIGEHLLDALPFSNVSYAVSDRLKRRKK